MFCVKCGAQNDNGGKFCVKCGAALIAPTQAQSPFQGPAPQSVPASAAVTVDVAGVKWRHVAIVGAAIVAIVGLNLPWLSDGYFTQSGFSFSYLLSFEAFILVALLVLTGIEALSPTTGAKLPLPMITMAISGFATFLTVVRALWLLIRYYSLFSIVGPFVTVLGNAGLLVIILMSRPGAKESPLDQPVFAKS